MDTLVVLRDEDFTCLRSMRTRGEGMKTTLQLLLRQVEELKSNPSSSLNWGVALEQFSVLAAQLQNLNDEFAGKYNQRANARGLSHLVSYPIRGKLDVPELSEQWQAAKFTELLRTKSLPELEEEQRNLVSQYEETVEEDRPPKRKATELQNDIEKRNTLCDLMLNHLEGKKRKFDFKTRQTLVVAPADEKSLLNVLISIEGGENLIRERDFIPTLTTSTGPRPVPGSGGFTDPKAATPTRTDISTYRPTPARSTVGLPSTSIPSRPMIPSRPPPFASNKVDLTSGRSASSMTTTRTHSYPFVHSTWNGGAPGQMMHPASGTMTHSASSTMMHSTPGLPNSGYPMASSRLPGQTSSMQTNTRMGTVLNRAPAPGTTPVLSSTMGMPSRSFAYRRVGQQQPRYPPNKQMGQS